MIEFLKLFNFRKLTSFQNLPIWKILFSQLEKLQKKNERINSKVKISNNSSFVIVIFAILEFRNIGHSTFSRSKFWPPPLFMEPRNDSYGIYTRKFGMTKCRTTDISKFKTCEY